MKKTILFLLLPLWVAAQTANGTETKANAFRALSPQTVTSPTFLTTTGTDGTQGKVLPANLPVSTATQIAIDAKVGDFINDGATTIAPSMNAVYDALAIKKDNTSTALKSGLAIVNNGTTFNINSGVYEIVDNSTTPATRATITFAGASNITPLYPRTIVYLDNAGAVQQLNGASGDLTPLQRRDNLFIGILSVFSGTIVAPQFTPSISYDDSGRIVDLSESIGVINRDGNLIGANGANLQFNKGAGHTFRVGGNYATDKKVPDVTTDAALVPVPAGINLVAYRNGSGGWTYEPFSGSITPNFWDNGTGTKATVDNNKFTTQRIYFFNGTDTFVIYLGQNQYASMDEAIAAVNNASRVIDPATSLASLRSSLVVKKNTTALNVATDAQFLEGPKINGGATGSAVASQNLQGTYNSSVTPHITTSTTGGALAIKRGSAADTDNVLVVQNGAGSDTFSVKGNGGTSVFGLLSGVNGNFSSSMQAASFNIPGGTSSQFLKADGSVDSNVYATNSSVVHLSGTETISGNKTFTGQNTFTSASSSTAITATASTSGNGITVNNNSNGNGFTVNNNSTGVGEIINSATASTSDLTRWQKNGTTTSKVDHNGNITGVSFIKSGATAGNILLAGGTDIAQSTFATATGGTGYIQNQNVLAQSADMWISGTGQFGNTGNNNNSVKVLDGTIITKIQSQTVGDSAGALGTETNHDLKLITNNTEKLRISTTGAATFASTVTASNGTLIGGTLTSGYIPKATGANSLGNSLIYDNGTNVGIGTASPANTLSVFTSSSTIASFTRDLATDATLSIGADNSGAYIETAGIHNLSVLTNSSERMRITSGGNVLIGTTTDDGVNKLQVNGGITTNAVSGIKFTNGSAWDINTDASTYNISETNIATRFTIAKTTGVVTINNLSGTGTRMVTADSSGNLAASTIVTSGTYTPTLTNTSNIASSSLNQATYTRIGNIINVNVSVATTVTATATPSVLTLTLPINTADTTQTGVGVGNLTAGDSTVNAAGIVGVISASTAEFVFYPTGSGSGTSAISFQYNLN